MYSQALDLLKSPPTVPDDKASLIEVLAINGAALARLHQFDDAKENLGQASQICGTSLEATCGDVYRAVGILAIQRGDINTAKQSFEQWLHFARTNKDRFLEITALLNLGLTALQEQRFDEAIDWTDSAYQAATALGAEGEAQTALGNLGWAYYNLGDSERTPESIRQWVQPIIRSVRSVDEARALFPLYQSVRKSSEHRAESRI